MVFSESGFDGWTAHLHDEGNMRNWTSWSKGTRVDINKTQLFGAHFYVGTVQVTRGTQSGVCYTTGPRVDDVTLYKS